MSAVRQQQQDTSNLMVRTAEDFYDSHSDVMVVSVGTEAYARRVREAGGAS